MNRTIRISLAAIMLTGLALLPAGAQDSGTQEQPLGDYARAVRKEKKQASSKTFDNDNLPTKDKLSVIGDAGTANAQTPQASDSTSNAAQSGAATDQQQDKMPTTTPGESRENRQQVYDQWKQQLDTQKQQIDLLSRELDVLQREYKLRAAAMYGDVGNRLRNSGEWDKEDGEYKQKIADKQKALDDAKKQMEDMQEEARKSGVPSSVRE